MNKYVVILGEGYAGIRALQKLEKHNEIRIILIDQNPCHLQTEVKLWRCP